MLVCLLSPSVTVLTLCLIYAKSCGVESRAFDSEPLHLGFLARAILCDKNDVMRHVIAAGGVQHMIQHSLSSLLLLSRLARSAWGHAQGGREIM